MITGNRIRIVTYVKLLFGYCRERIERFGLAIETLEADQAERLKLVTADAVDG